LFEVVKHTPGKLLIKLSGSAKTNDVLQYLINEKTVLHSFNEVLPSLNEIFIKLVESTASARQFQQVN
jgi:ABC-2 type transport system ATP-binding protein